MDPAEPSRKEPHEEGPADSPVVEIGSLAYGRAAVARIDGKVFFVEGAAPGDHVRLRRIRDRGTYAEAEVAELVAPGPLRVAPPCPIVDRCGGCCWQHVRYPAQLEAKRTAVVDALERIAGISDPPVGAVVASPRELGYRNRLKLRFEKGKLGFYRAATHSLVPIEDCSIADERVRAALPPVERFVAGLESDVTRVEIASRGLLPGVVVALNGRGRMRRGDDARVRALLEAGDHDVAGVVMWGRGWRREWGELDRRFEVDDGLVVETAAASFGQVNAEANRLLVRAVLDAAEPRALDTVLDLYAGSGNLSLPLARRSARVDAVEADADAVEAGRDCARRQEIRNVTFHAARVEAFLADSRTHTPPDLVVANPPRSGFAAAAAMIAALRAPRLLVVSCNPATFARDAKTLVAHGYSLRSVTPFDLFPHTFHVEIVCDARLT